MTRRAHWLRTTATASYPSDLVVFDTETTERPYDEGTVEHCLEFGWAARTEYTSRGDWTEPRWFRFTDAAEFWDWLESQCRAKRALWVYCHNANFDWQVVRMTTVLAQLGWKCDTAILEDPPNYFRWKKGNKTLKLLDSTNYWRVSLKELGKRLGLEKLEMPADWHDKEQADTYCRRDCEILLRSLQTWIAWLREHELGGLGISLAQQAWKAYCHRFMQAPIYIDDNEEALALSRSSYYGGRVECWTVGTAIQNVTVLDINSMYPALMREHEYPTQLHGIYRNVTPAELADWLSKYALCASVTINARDPIYPERTPDGLAFPIGQFTTCLSTPELALAQERDEITAIHAVAVYDKAIIFRDFVDYMWPLRLAYQEACDAIADFYTKLMTNSLYGKFGQRGGHEVIVGECDPEELYVETEIDLETGKKYRRRHIAGLILCREPGGESRYSHPAIVSHVTAYGRVMLWQLATCAGYQNVHYMDTDSLHVTGEGVENLRSYINPKQLGALKIEKTVETAIYYGPKDYELDNVRKIKGVSKNAVETDIATFSQSQWVSLRGSCMMDHSGGPLVKRVTKHYSRRYWKGERLATGRVLPIRRLTPEIGGVLSTAPDDD